MATQQQTEDSANIAGQRATQQQSEDSANVAGRRAATQQQSEDSANVAGQRATQQQTEESPNVAGQRATQQQTEESPNVAGQRATQQQTEESPNVAGLRATQQQSEDSANVAGQRATQQQTEDQFCATVMHFPDKSEESEHLSMFLNAYENSKLLVKLFQHSKKIMNDIVEYLCDLHSCLYHKYHHTIVGSTAEGLCDNESDQDVIMFNSRHVVIESGNDTYDCPDPDIVVIRIPDEGHPGYSKLSIMKIESFEIGKAPSKYRVIKNGILYLKNSTKELLHSVVKFPTQFSINGPAFHTESNDHHVKEVYQDFGIETQIFREYHRLSDIVFCIKSTKWPVEASEWIRRKRASNWPTKELFETIINSGYYLAAVGSKESEDNEIQWRVSFNKAELLIIESFNETQIHCICLLKILKTNCLSEIAGNNITSYTMKTVMFWCLEEISDEFWQSSNLMSCFCFCVSKLKSFVEERFIPNYFIRNRNQFIASEFTFEMQTKTCQYLEIVLENPKHGISLLLPSYQYCAYTSISELHSISLKYFIENWLRKRLSITQEYYVVTRDLLWKLYNGYNIQNILSQCEKALEKLETISYTQPLIKNLQNYMGFLQYILLREEKKSAEDRKDSDRRNKYSTLMKLSASGDLTHNPLRIATCYLDDGIKEDCIKIIRSVTELDDHFFIQTYSQRFKKTIECDTDAFKQKKHTVDELNVYYKIIKDIDFFYQDPYRTTEEFEKMKRKGNVLIGYDALNLAWRQCYFDVTFMQAELPVLPKPVALELCVDNNQKHVSFHPFLYGLLLEFLWHQKYGSGNRKKELVLGKMEHCVSIASIIPEEQKSTGLNFMTYCFLLQKEYCSARRCLIQSFKLKPIPQNVAHLYMKYIAKQLLELSLDSTT